MTYRVANVALDDYDDAQDYAQLAAAESAALTQSYHDGVVVIIDMETAEGDVTGEIVAVALQLALYRRVEA